MRAGVFSWNPVGGHVLFVPMTTNTTQPTTERNRSETTRGFANPNDNNNRATLRSNNRSNGTQVQNDNGRNEAMTAAIQCYEILDSKYGEDRSGCLPERVEWIDFEVRKYADGTTIKFVRECGRWSSVGRVGDWMPEGDLIARNALNTLAKLRRDCALYLHTRDNPGTQPNPPLKTASNPATYPDTWEMYIRKEADKAPRETACMYSDCADGTAERKCAYCRGQEATRK